MFKAPKSVMISGKEVLPIIEGGKGVAVTSGQISGAFAAAGAVGTFSGVNADTYDENGKPLPQIYHAKTRRERHEELIAYGIEGGITQARIAHEISGGKGRIHMNILWEMGGAEQILHGILEKTKGLIHGVTCGAGMPYRLGDIAAQYKVYYHPIISSMRAFRALWKRSYSKTSELLGSVVYEDPWLAGGHNGLSNSEDPLKPENPFGRVAELRKFMNEVGLQQTPIIMAGGVWHLKDWQDFINNPEIGEVAFQFGTRPIVTKESPVPDSWKQKLMTLNEGDISLNQFSPTGFYSSAVRNGFLKELEARQDMQIEYAMEPEGYLTEPLPVGARQRLVYVSPDDYARAQLWIKAGFNEPMKTPESTLIFVTPQKSNEILKDQIDCMGCLSHCRFSGWKDHDEYKTGKKPDPRSFCIQKALQAIIHDDHERGEPTEHQLMFSGHNGYKFASDPFYANGNIPTVKQLVERIMTGS
jgi:nitronate monooxygenase